MLRLKRSKEISLRIVVLFVLFLVTTIFVTIFYNNFYLDGQMLSFEYLFGSVEKAGRSGGIGPILISTILVLIIAILPTLIISVISGHYLYLLSMRSNLLYRLLDIFTYVLAAVPSVVMGLFGNIFFVDKLGLGYSIISGGLTLCCMILPLTIKVVERSFVSINSNIVKSAYSLGIGQFNTFFKILLPCAKQGILTALVIGLGRALSETAALLFTSGYVTRSPESLLDSGRVLSVHIFELVMNVPGGDLMAKKSVTLLFVFVIIFNFFALKLMKGPLYENRL